MSLKIGIVGLPNVGKSTLFNALLREAQAQAANFPFCTIEPNVGMVAVPDERLQILADIVHTQTIIPATVQFVDIAGLVAGAHKGEGLGNQFLSHIREADAILMVVRCFADQNVLHVAGRVDPKADIQTIKLELILADLQTVEKLLLGNEKKLRSGDKAAVIIGSGLKKILECLNAEQEASKANLTDEEKAAVKHLQLLTTKPMLFVGNAAEEEVTKSPLDFGLPENSLLISAKIESELIALPEEEQADYLLSIGLKESGLLRLIHSAYRTLGLQSFFTAGPKEVRAWTVQKGATAPQAAGVIHTDFEKGFIRAEVIAYKDMLEAGSEQKVKELGKMRVEGKDYVVQEGDIMHFRFSN